MTPASTPTSTARQRSTPRPHGRGVRVAPALCRRPIRRTMARRTLVRRTLVAVMTGLAALLPLAAGTATTAAAQQAVSQAPLSIPFETGSADIPTSGRRAVEDFARGLPDRTRVLVDAYATAAADAPPHAARRLALDRALAVREILSGAGIGPTRIELKVHGAAPDGPADRVDLDIRGAG